MLPCRGLCVELITRPEECYRLWCVVESSRNLVNEEAPDPLGGGSVASNKKRDTLAGFEERVARMNELYGKI